MKTKTPHIVSSLTFKEIAVMLEESYLEDGQDDEMMRLVLNAAAQRALEELPLPCQAWWRRNGWSESEARIAAEAIQCYLRDIKEGKL